MEKIIPITLIVVMMLVVPASAFADQFKIKVKHWSIAGDAQVCLVKQNGKESCTKFEISHKSKIEHKVVISDKRGFIEYGETYKVCVVLKPFGTNEYWQDCVIDKKNKEIENLKLTLQAR
jgi:hypothetical protein